MTVPMWNPPMELTRREQRMLKRRTKKLFGFLREHRHELFDEAFQKELASMYRDTGEGKSPVAPVHAVSAHRGRAAGQGAACRPARQERQHGGREGHLGNGGLARASG